MYNLGLKSAPGVSSQVLRLSILPDTKQSRMVQGLTQAMLLRCDHEQQ